MRTAFHMMHVILRIIIYYENLMYLCEALKRERGIIYGVSNPSSLSNLAQIPQSNGAFNYSQFPVSGDVRSLAVDPKRRIVFMSVQTEIFAIYNYSLLQTDSYVLKTDFQGKSDDSGEIAFDYLSNNLFWCDSRLNWVAMKSAYTDNASLYKVLVQENLRRPEGLALDAMDGLMFFSDNDPKGRITRASMNGENATVIVYKGLIHVPSLSIDPKNDLLYWTDVVRDTVEVCDYDGSNRRVVKRSNNVPLNGVQYHQNILHLVSSSWKSVRGIDPISGTLLYLTDFTLGTPTSLAVYDTENVPNLIDPCLSGECEHICVNTPTGPSCLCYEGYELEPNGYSCKNKSVFFGKGFIISHENTFEMINILSINGAVERSVQIQDKMAHIQSFAVDANKEIIYFIDSNANALKELHIDTQQIHVLTSLGEGRDLVFDWQRDLLGWIDNESSEILSLNLYTKLQYAVYSGLSYSQSLAVDPYDGKLFWISGSPPSMIMRGSWNGAQLESLLTSSDVYFPRTLKFDVTNNRLYWLDGSLIKSSFANGYDVQTHSLAIDSTDALIYKDIFIWMNADQLYFGLKTSNRFYSSMDISENATGVALYDTLLQKNLTGSCQISNGGCEDICIPHNDGHRCACSIGQQGQNNSQTCSSKLLDKNFLLVTDGTHDRLFQVDLATGDLFQVPFSAPGASGLAYDSTTDTVFFTTTKTTFSSKVISFSLHGAKNITTYSSGFEYSESVALDYSTGNIYFTFVTSSGEDAISVVHRKMFLQKTLLTNLQTPRDLALYSSKGFIFWVEVGVPRIGRAFMDGTSKTYIVTNDITWPNGVAIDFFTGKLYWTDGFTDKIECSDVNGGNRKVFIHDTYAHLRSIFVGKQFIFYTGYNRQQIIKIDKSTGSRIKFMENYPELGVLSTVLVYSDNDTLDVNPICARSNGFCSTFCFPTPSGRTCGCQDKVKLLSDQKTCEGVSTCPKTFSNLYLSDCGAFSGELCDYECKSGFKKTTKNTSITCTAFGHWEPDITSLCEEMLCPVSLPNAALASGCNRKPGETCSFLCRTNYRPSFSDDIFCSENGEWGISNSTQLCKREVTATQPLTDMTVFGTIAGIGIVFLFIVVFVVYSKRKRKRKKLSEQQPQLTVDDLQQDNGYVIRSESSPEDEYNTLDEMNFRDLGYIEFTAEHQPYQNEIFYFDVVDTEYAGYLTPVVVEEDMIEEEEEEEEKTI